MSPIEIHAFILGLTDRMAGKPMLIHASLPDNGAINDAYACGYDPHGEQCSAPEVAALTERLAAAADIFIPAIADLPHNQCEFPDYR